MKKTTLFFLFLIAFAFTDLVNGASSRIINLKCEHSANPTGIDTPNPRLSWNICSTERNWNQSAYHIIVASDSLKLSKDESDIWDSGKIVSSECLYIQFRGKPLTALQKYFWKVKVWDNNGIESD